MTIRIFGVSILLASWGVLLLPIWLSGFLGVCTYSAARLGGLVLAALVPLSFFLLIHVGIRHRRVLAIIFVANLVFQVAAPFTFYLFMQGFKTRVLHSAPVSAWAHLPSQVGALPETSPSKTLNRDQLPGFVAQLYPTYRQIWCSLTGTPQQEGVALIIWWLDTRCCIGVAIGTNYTGNSGTIYLRELGDGVYVTAFKMQ